MSLHTFKLRLKTFLRHDGQLAAFLATLVPIYVQEGLAVASIARDVVVEMTPPRDDNAR